MTTRCTPRKLQPRAYPPLSSENRASLVGSFTRARGPRLRACRIRGLIHPQLKGTTKSAQQCVYKQALAREIAGLTGACPLT